LAFRAEIGYNGRVDPAATGETSKNRRRRRARRPAKRRKIGDVGVGGGAVPLRTSDILTRAAGKINRKTRFLPRFCRFINVGASGGEKKDEKRRRFGVGE